MVVIHLDLDAFFVAVERLRDPSLRGQPVVVGGRPEARGVVASASYEARRYGVRSAMPTAQALRLCPDLVIVRPHYRLYRHYSDRVMAILRQVTPLVEPISIDEAFLDVTECAPMWGGAEALARALQSRIEVELGLSASLGVASNKLVAKIASDLRKPHGLVVVPPGEEASFLAPLPVERLWGVGEVTARRLHEAGIRTIGDLARQPPARLAEMFGAHGLEMWWHAQGHDPRPVEVESAPKSVSREVTFARDVTDPERMRRTLLWLSESVGARLRRHRLRGKVVVLKLRYSDFSTLTRRITLSTPTDLDDVIYQQALSLWRKAYMRGRPVRLLGVGVTNLSGPERQLTLFPEEADDRRERLALTLDEIRQRFGPRSVVRASLLQDMSEADEDRDEDEGEPSP